MLGFDAISEGPIGALPDEEVEVPVMTTLTVGEAALHVVTMRLDKQLQDVTVERDRRSPVDTDKDPLPHLVVALESLDADTAQEPGATHYRIVLSVTGHVRGAEDTGAARALQDLWARVIAVLAGWTPDPAGLGDVGERTTEFGLLDADESAAPAGFFVAGFDMLAITPTGDPFITL